MLLYIPFTYLRWFEWVICGEVNCKEKYSSLIWTVRLKLIFTSKYIATSHSKHFKYKCSFSFALAIKHFYPSFRKGKRNNEILVITFEKRKVTFRCSVILK